MWSAVVAQPITMVIQIIQSLGYIALLYWAWPYIQHSFYRLCFTLCGENGAYHLFTTEYYWHDAFPADGVI